MRVVYLAAGAAGMVCGSCLRDNRLVLTLREMGRDVTLVPLYTPIRTDEDDASEPTVFYGGVNVYLQQKSALFRAAPRALDRVLDSTALLRRVGRLASRTRAEDLGELTVSVLRGEHGRQRKELRRLVEGLRPLAPAIVNLPNLMFLGVARALRQELGAKIVCTLSGEDVFLDRLAEPQRTMALDEIASAAQHAHAFVGVTRYFADYAALRFRLPPERVTHVPMGIASQPEGQSAPPAPPFRIGYVARVCADKGLMNLVEALIELRRRGRDALVVSAGWLGEGDRAYYETVRARVRAAGVQDRFEYLGEVSRAQKLELLRSVHAFSVPADFPEAKGLSILEALGAGVPVVQPRQGSYPELVEQTGGGLLYDPTSLHGLADGLESLMNDETHRSELARRARTGVREHYSDHRMAASTWALYEQLASRGSES